MISVNTYGVTMIKLSLSAIALAALMTGCASVPMANKADDTKFKAFPLPDTGNAGVYVYRDSIFGSALKKDLWIDGKCLGESASGVFFYQQVKGGEDHKISTESEFSANDLIVKTDANKNYFIIFVVFIQYIPSRYFIFISSAIVFPKIFVNAIMKIIKLQIFELVLCR